MTFLIYDEASTCNGKHNSTERVLFIVNRLILIFVHAIVSNVYMLARLKSYSYFYQLNYIIVCSECDDTTGWMRERYIEASL